MFATVGSTEYQVFTSDSKDTPSFAFRMPDDDVHGFDDSGWLDG